MVHVLNKSGAGQTKWSIFMFIISGQGRKRGGACATGAITLQDRKTFNFDGQTQNHNQQKEWTSHNVYAQNQVPSWDIQAIWKPEPPYHITSWSWGDKIVLFLKDLISTNTT